MERSPCDSFPAVRSLSFWILLVGAAIHGTILLQAQPLQSANDRSRWATARALLEQGTYYIDDVRRDRGWDTIDLVKDGEHYLSTKPPILATWVAGLVWCLCKLTGWTLLSNTQSVTSWTLLIANGLPMLVSWIALDRMLRAATTHSFARGFVLSTAVFATLLTPFCTTLNNHSVAAAGAMLTIYALWKIERGYRSWGRKAPETGRELATEHNQGADAPRSEDLQPSSFWFALCGFFSAWTCAHELPAALLGVATFLLACRRSLVKTLVAYVPAAMVPLAFFFVTTWLATGGLKPAYSDYGTEKYRFVVEGVPSYWMEPKGIDIVRDSTPVYLMHCLVGHHGLFSLTPVWLLLLPAWAWLVWTAIWRQRSPVLDSGERLEVDPDDIGGAQTSAALRTISWLSLALTVAVLGFYLSRTENYNYGGNTAGLRWLLWLVPFWLATLIPLAERWSPSWIFRLAVIPLFLLSAYSAWSRIDNPWRHPWIFEWMQKTGRVDLSEPRPDLPHRQWTWFTAVPDVGDGQPRWMEFVNASATTGACRLRVEARPAASGDANRVRLLITRRCGNAEAEPLCDVELDRVAFENGAEPDVFLHWPDDIATADRQRQMAFLRGLPRKQEYRPGVIRYRKTPLRRDAFRCQHVLARTNADTRNYRCDLWKCEELPFGVAEYEFQVHDAATGLLLRQERWQAAASEPPPLPHAQWTPLP
jgi:hypothetical protein